MTAIDIIVQFVEGKMGVEELQNELKSNVELIELLLNNTARSTVDFSGGQSLLFAITQKENINSVVGHANILSDLEYFLKTEQVTFNLDEKPYELLDLVLNSMPGYVYMDVDMISEFFCDNISPIINAEITTIAKKIQIREKFKSHFQYQSKPPRWIQGSDWLMNGDVPLFFVGQVSLKHDSFQDDSVIYIFLDTESGKIETVQQFY